MIVESVVNAEGTTREIVNDVSTNQNNVFYYIVTEHIINLSELSNLIMDPSNTNHSVVFGVDVSNWSTNCIPVGEGNTYYPGLIISRDMTTKKWSVRSNNESEVLDGVVNMTLFTKCWSTDNNHDIKDLLNDTFERVFTKLSDQHDGSTTGASNPILTNESIDPDRVVEDELSVQYSIEFNHQVVLDYINTHYEDTDPDALDESVSDDDKITSFIESLFNTDDVLLNHVDEGIDKVIVDVAASYVLGKTTLGILDKLGTNIIKMPKVAGDPNDFMNKMKSARDHANRKR